MFTCHACTRHVMEDSKACPFCGVTLRSGTSPAAGGFVMTAVLGLALVGCTDPDTGDEGASTQSMTDPSATSQGTTTGGESSPGDTFEAEAADYGGPTGIPPDTTGSAETTSGPLPETGTTDTGATTNEPGTDTEGADYAGPASTG